MSALGVIPGFLRPLLAALVVAALLIPTLDAFRCIDDVAQAAPASAAHMVGKTALAKDVSGVPHDADPDQDGSGLCPHGHCHYPPGMTRAIEAPGTPTTVATFEPYRGADAAPPSRPPLGLLRPPRA
jgi:hypothetical protein